MLIRFFLVFFMFNAALFAQNQNVERKITVDGAIAQVLIKKPVKTDIIAVYLTEKGDYESINVVANAIALKAGKKGANSSVTLSLTPVQAAGFDAYLKKYKKIYFRLSLRNDKDEQNFVDTPASIKKLFNN